MVKKYYLLILGATSNSYAESFACSGIIDFMLISKAGNVEVYSSQLYDNGVGRNIYNLTTT